MFRPLRSARPVIAGVSPVCAVHDIIKDSAATVGLSPSCSCRCSCWVSPSQLGGRLATWTHPGRKRPPRQRLLPCKRFRYSNFITDSSD